MIATTAGEEGTTMTAVLVIIRGYSYFECSTILEKKIRIASITPWPWNTKQLERMFDKCNNEVDR